MVCDPVLLLRKKEWEKRCVPISTKRPYVLCYNLLQSEKCAEQARKVSRELGYELINITACLLPFKSGRRYLQTLDPISFISYFKEAAFVVTSSFHGTVFSVVFQKPFYVVGMGSLGGRSASLLAKLNLSDRIVYICVLFGGRLYLVQNQPVSLYKCTHIAMLRNVAGKENKRFFSSMTSYTIL